MFATGRKPSTKGLGLEDAGVRLDERSGAILVDGFSRTSVPSIWAIGDVTERMSLTPVALMEGKALAATLFGGKPTVPDYDNVSVELRYLWGGCGLSLSQLALRQPPPPIPILNP